MYTKVKILIVGPCKSGKTLLSNILSYANRNHNDNNHTNVYKPTKLSRILWFEVNGVPVNNNQRSFDVAVELWDCSGDRSFEMCWPSMLQNTHGIIFVYDPQVQNHVDELQHFYEKFVRRDFGITDQQCIIFAHERGMGESLREELAPRLLKNILVVRASLDEDGSAVRTHFKSFLSRVISGCHSGENRQQNPIIT